MTSPHSPQDGGAAPSHVGGGTFSPASWPRRPLKPGTMELAPADVNGVLSAAFSTLRANPAASLGAAILPILLVSVTAVTAFLVALSVLADDLPDLDGDEWHWPASITAGTLVSLILGGALLALGAALVASLVTAALVHVFGQGVLGRKATLSSSLRTGVSRMWQVLGTCVLGGAAVIGAFVLVIVLAVAVSGESDAVAGLVLIIGVLAVLPLVVLVVIRTLFAASAVVIERLGPIDALKRSWVLTRGRFWRTFGVMVLVGCITSAISGLVSSATDRFTPDVDSSSLNAGIVVAMIVVTIVTTCVNATCQAISVFASTALYLDACMRDEDLAQALVAITGHRTQADGQPLHLAAGELAFPSSPTLVPRAR